MSASVKPSSSWSFSCTLRAFLRLAHFFPFQTFLLTLTHRVLEQPLKIPFTAAVILYANDTTPEVARETLAKAGAKAQELLDQGDWRGFKLVLRLFACMQVLFEGDGVYSILDELFNQAVDLQAASSEDVIPTPEL